MDKYVGGYEAWVCANTSIARNMENLLYIAPQLTPKSFGDKEVTTEAGYSLVGLLRLYHDYILYKQHAPTSSEWTLTRAMRLPLSILSHVQVLAEVLARKLGGDRGKWRLIVTIEALKVLCRLILLHQAPKSMLLGGGKYKATEVGSASKKKTKTPNVGSRTGKAFGKSSNSTTDASLASPVAQRIVFNDAIAQVASGDERRLLAGEVLHIVRPLVYATLRKNRPQESWTPFVLSLLVEGASLWLTTSTLQQSEKLKTTDEELGARKMALLLYLLRDPVFHKATKPATDKVCDALDYVPLVGKVVRYASSSLLDYYHQYYFYTSTS